MTKNIVEGVVFDTICSLSNGGEPVGESNAYRIVLTSEGKHNGMYFSGEELKAGVLRSVASLGEVPLIVGHYGDIRDICGSVTDLTYSDEVTTDKGVVKNTSVADIQYWTNTPTLEEVAVRVRNNPKMVKYSAQWGCDMVKGEDDDEINVINLRLNHIAMVLIPADGNAGIVAVLEKQNRQTIEDARKVLSGKNSDLTLNNSLTNGSIMADTDITESVRKDLTIATQRVASLESEVKARDAEIVSLNQKLEAAVQEAPARAERMAKIQSLGFSNSTFVASLSMEQMDVFIVDLEAKETEKARLEAVAEAARVEAEKRVEEIDEEGEEEDEEEDGEDKAELGKKGKSDFVNLSGRGMSGSNSLKGKTPDAIATAVFGKVDVSGGY